MPAFIHRPSSGIGWISSKFSDACCALPIYTFSYRLSELVETVSKKAIPEHQKRVIFDLTCEDMREEDVEVPYVMLNLSK